MGKAWKINESEYCAYEKAVNSAKTDQEALTRCKLIKEKQPNWRPDRYSRNLWGPLHLSIGRHWIETSRWLFPYCNATSWDDWSDNVFQYCYGIGNAPESLREPSMIMAKLLVEEGNKDPRTTFLMPCGSSSPLYNYGAYLLDACKEDKSHHTKWRELDAYFKQKSFEFQEETGMGVQGFPVLQQSDLAAA